MPRILACFNGCTKFSARVYILQYLLSNYSNFIAYRFERFLSFTIHLIHIYHTPQFIFNCMDYKK